VNDNDTLIRDRLAAAATFDVVTEPERVHEGVARQRRRIRRRRRGAAVAVVVAVAGFGGAGVALTLDRATQPDVTVQADATDEAPSSSDVPTASGSPRFLPAPGWEVVQGEWSTTASNIPMGPDTQSGGAPWDTVERLGEGDVVIWAMLLPAGENALVDANFPPGELPLSLDDAPPGGLEGNPEVGLTLRTGVQVNGWNIDLMVFYGTAVPSAETRAAAQEQLARLDVPSR
jgi:hypothetical protein